MPAIVPLVSKEDPDYASFQSGDDTFFLNAAGREVRKYCGWHIYPSKVEENVRREITRGGVILLKSLYVTDVSSVIVDGRTLVPPPPAGQSWDAPGQPRPEYRWETAGIIHRTWPSWPRDDWATVSFTHGYDELPEDIKAVVFELAIKAKELPAGNIRSIGTAGFQYTLGQLGLGLDDLQRNRLADYRIVTF